MLSPIQQRLSHRLLRPFKERPWVSLCLILILFGATLSRFYAIGEHSIWLDEAITVRSLGSLKQAVMQPFHPPLHYTGLWFFSQVFGMSAGALRAFSAVFGVGTVWLTYRVGRELFASRAPAVLSALMVAALPAAIFFSREARMYALWQFFFTMGFYGLLRLRGAERIEWKTAALYLGGIVGGQLTHHYMAFYTLPCVMGAFLLIGKHPLRKSGRDIRNWLTLHLPIIAAAVVLFGVLAMRKGGVVGAGAYVLKAMGRGKAGFEISEVVPLVWFVNWVYSKGLPGSNAIAAILIVAFVLACVAMYYGERAEKRGAVAFALALAIPLFLINWLPIRNYTRLYLPSVTLLALVFGYLCWLPVRALGKPGWFWSLTLVALLGYTAYPFQKKVYTLEAEPWNKVCAHLSKQDSGADGVYISARYMIKPLSVCYAGSAKPEGFKHYKQIRDKVSKHKQVWLIYSHAWGGDARKRAVKQLKKSHRLVKRWKAGKDIVVFRFKPKPAASLAAKRANAKALTPPKLRSPAAGQSK